MEITKVNDNIISVEKVETINYSYNILIEKKAFLLNRKEDIENELIEIEKLIEEAEKLGLTSLNI